MSLDRPLAGTIEKIKGNIWFALNAATTDEEGLEYAKKFLWPQAKSIIVKRTGGALLLQPSEAKNDSILEEPRKRPLVSSKSKVGKTKAIRRKRVVSSKE